MKSYMQRRTLWYVMRASSMRYALISLFTLILVLMIVVTTRASLDSSIVEALGQLLPDRWFQATLCDAYCGFVTFFVWVFYKERRPWKRAAWFLLIMGLGNIAMSIYALIQLAKMDPESSWNGFLTEQNA